MAAEKRSELTALLALCFQQLETTEHAQTRDVLHCMIERLEEKLDELDDPVISDAADPAMPASFSHS
jgi:hypothetical protein